MENLQLIYRSIDWYIYLYRLNAGSLTSNRFGKPTYKVAFLRHRRSSVAFPASQECDTGGLKVNIIPQCMSSNLLCLSPSKTEFIILSLPNQIKRISETSMDLPTSSPPSHSPPLLLTI